MMTAKYVRFVYTCYSQLCPSQCMHKKRKDLMCIVQYKYAVPNVFYWTRNQEGLSNKNGLDYELQSKE